jgi:hypothetical protein
VLDLTQELEALVATLTTDGIEFAICGGIAMAIHGVPRFTKDIDLLVPKASIETALSAAAKCGFKLPAGPMTFDVGTPRERAIRRISKIDSGQLLTLDLLAVEPSFGEVWRTRERVEWRGKRVQVVSREGLGIMKRMAGRPQDKWDLEALGLEQAP